LCCLDDLDFHNALARRWFGIDRTASQASILGERVYDISTVGFKYHLNDLAAALGLGNLEGLRDRLGRRQSIAAFYRSRLISVPGLNLLHIDEKRTHAYWLFTIRVERREDFIRKLASHQVPASVVHLRIDHNSVFGGLRDDLPGQADFDNCQVSIPVHEGLSDDMIEHIATTIQSGW
jgi:perosamine synthetase